MVINGVVYVIFKVMYLLFLKDNVVEVVYNISLLFMLYKVIMVMGVSDIIVGLLLCYCLNLKNFFVIKLFYYVKVYYDSFYDIML